MERLLARTSMLDILVLLLDWYLMATLQSSQSGIFKEHLKGSLLIS